MIGAEVFMANFVHLHNHTDFSLLDGAAKIPDMVAKAKSYGMTHLAITDHGNMFGALKFYQECRNQEITPIVGCEVYVTDGSRFDRKRNANGERESFHLILLAKNNEGYKNIMRISSLGYTEGFYYRPRVDWETLEKYSDHIVCLSACLAGKVAYLLTKDRYEEAKEQALAFQELYGKGNFFLEMQNHFIAEQEKVNEGVKRISKETGIDLVATNDIHYVNQEDYVAQDILLCIGTNRKRNDPNRMRFPGDHFYLKSEEEMAELFPKTPEALTNTLKVAELCSNLEIELPGPMLPAYGIPQGFDNPDEYLKHLTKEGLSNRYSDVTEEIIQRMDFELNIIISMGFTGYFLIVWDFINYARVNKIPVGPGRGSGAGSIVAYALGITDIDPLKYQLLFERFLNPERVSMPDFDIDFCFEQRQEVIDYVSDKYGESRVGQIITFGTMKARAVIKDVARAMDIPYAESDMIAKLIPMDPKMTIKKAMDIEPKLAEVRSKGPLYQELFSISEVLEGSNRHCSTHAAGVVIGHTELLDIVPLYRDPKTQSITTQYTMDQLEDCGLVKMDFLGLKTLTLIKHSEELIRKRGIDFSITTIPEDDEPTFTLLGKGHSTCIFQFESAGMQGILKQAQPNSIEDLIALNALYRPGPMQNIPRFVECKHGRQAIEYPHPDLTDVLKPTYGVIVYQEQVMQVAQIIGGFSLGKADILRRAMGKKKVKEMDRMKVEFVDGAVEKGYDKKLANDIFDMLVPFAGYGFNKSHAAAYSVLAYQTAYLKANYPAEFMAANLTNEITSPDKLAQYIGECKAMELVVRPPSINYSEKLFSVVDGDIVYGLKGIKNLGESVVEEIIKEREENGPYTSLLTFLQRIESNVLNRRALESLIYAGAMDCFGETRNTLLENLQRHIYYVEANRQMKQHGQTLLFGDDSEDDVFDEVEIVAMQQVEEMDQREKLEHEKHLLGFYFSGHPLDEYKEAYEKVVTVKLGEREKFQPGKEYGVIGIISELRQIVTKKGDAMAFITIEDYSGSIEAVVFPKTWAANAHLLEKEKVIGCTITYQVKEGRESFLVDSIEDPHAMKERNFTEVHLKAPMEMCTKRNLEELRSLLFNHQGSCTFHIHIEGENRSVMASAQLRVKYSHQLMDELQSFPLVTEVWGA